MVHIIKKRYQRPDGTTSVECTCGESFNAPARMPGAAERRYDDHILAAIRANRAADKAAG